MTTERLTEARVRVVAWGGSFLAVALATLIAWAIPPLRANPFLLFLGAVSIVAWRWGRAPSLLAIGLSFFAIDYLLFHPIFSVSVTLDQAYEMAVFVGVALLISVLSAARREAETQLSVANGKLQEMIAQMRSVMDSSPIGLCFHDCDLRFVAINPALAAINGVSAENTIGRTVREVLPPNLASTVEPLLRGVVESGAPNLGVEMSSQVEDEPNRKRHWLASYFPVRTTGQVLIGVGVAVTETTQQKLLETRLRESEERFRSSFEDAAIGMALLAPDGHFLKVNRPFCEMAGYSEEEILARGYQSITHPDDHEQDREIMRRLASGEITRADYEKRRIHKDGHVIWVRVTGRLMRDADSRPLYYIVQVQDISQRKKAMTILKEAHEELRTQAHETLVQLAAIVESSTSAIFSFDLDGLIIQTWNPAAERLYGYSAEEIIGKSLLVTVPPDRFEQVAKNREQCLRGQPVEIPNGVAVRKDSQQIHVHASVTPIRDATGQVTVGCAIVDDITERLQLEEQFRQAQKMEAIGLLAGGVAHDFNNLLTVISGYSDLALKRAGLDDKAKDYLTEVRKAGERAQALTRQLLAFSRKQVLQPTLVDLNSTVKDLEKMLRRLIGEDITLTTSLDPLLQPVKVDPGQIEQVVMNIVVNARDAMPQGGELTLETAHVDVDEAYCQAHHGMKPGSFSVLAITDTGVGMDEQTKARVFEPFFTTKGVHKGTGLGLAMVYGFIKQSEGYISVDSEPGLGTTFKVYLPQVEPGAIEATSKNKRSSIEKMPRGTETVLLVEDEDSVRSFALGVLQSCGYKVLDAPDGSAAINVAECHEGMIHLLISDVVMPEMGGRKLADQLIDSRPGIKTLFVSGYMDDAVMRHGISQYKMNFLQKPYSPSALAQRVREVLDQ